MADLAFLTEPSAEPEHPSLARIADWLLGGTQNWEVDRAAAARLESMNPEVRDLLLENRFFQRRAVGFALSEGIRQFVDIGSGLPTAGSAHEVADRAVPDARVVYVDVDPLVCAHAAHLLDGTSHRVVPGDLLDPAGLWRSLDGLVDPREPACLLVTGLLHFIRDVQGPAEHLARHRDALAPGSLLVLSQSTAEGVADSKLEEQAAEFHGERDPGQLRTRAELATFFGDFEIIDPGVVLLPGWRPSAREASPFAGDPVRSQQLGGVGRKR